MAEKKVDNRDATGEPIYIFSPLKIPKSLSL